MADQTADTWPFQVDATAKSVSVTNTAATHAAVARGLGIGPRSSIAATSSSF